MSHYLSPKADLTFKRIFANPRHKERCISMLNALLPLEPDRKIADVSFESGELLPRTEDEKKTIADVRCTDQQGRQFLVEMQMEWTDAFKVRVLLNASKAFVSQFRSSDPYGIARPVYSLNFINDKFDKTPDYYHYLGICERGKPEETGQQIEFMHFILVELPKFKPSNKAEAKLRDLWLRFLTEMDGKPEKIPEEFKEHAEILSAVECLEESNYTAEQLRDYDKYWDAVRCEKTLLIGRFHEGHAEGRVEGRVEGLAEGLEKGRAESAEKIAAERAKTAAAEEKAAAAAAKAAAANRNTARALKAAGVSPEVIAQSTGIPAAEIARL